MLGLNYVVFIVEKLGHYFISHISAIMGALADVWMEKAMPTCLHRFLVSWSQVLGNPGVLSRFWVTGLWKNV